MVAAGRNTTSESSLERGGGLGFGGRGVTGTVGGVAAGGLLLSIV